MTQIHGIYIWTMGVPSYPHYIWYLLHFRKLLTTKCYVWCPTIHTWNKNKNQLANSIVISPFWTKRISTSNKKRSHHQSSSKQSHPPAKHKHTNHPRSLFADATETKRQPASQPTSRFELEQYRTSANTPHLYIKFLVCNKRRTVHISPGTRANQNALLHSVDNINKVVVVVDCFFGGWMGDWTPTRELNQGRVELLRWNCCCSKAVIEGFMHFKRRKYPPLIFIHRNENMKLRTQITFSCFWKYYTCRKLTFIFQSTGPPLIKIRNIKRTQRYASIPKPTNVFQFPFANIAAVLY